MAACGGDLAPVAPEVQCATPPPVPLLPEGQPLVAVPAPVAVTPRDPAIALAMRESDTCALQASGAVTCWGYRFTTPHRIAGWTDISKLEFPGGMLCGLHRDGRVECGDLDVEIVEDRARLPMQTLGGVTAARDVVAYGDTACVLERTGDVGCWMAGTAPRVTRVRRLSGATALVMGQLTGAGPGWGGSSYGCALAGGRLACFEIYDRRPLDAFNQPIGPRPLLDLGAPRVVRGLAGLTGPLTSDGWPPDLLSERGQGPVCARTADGAPRCVWPSATGENKPAEPPEPAEAPDRMGACVRHEGTIACDFRGIQTVHLERVSQFTSDWDGACAIHGGGAVSCWGNDESCELGRSGCEDAVSTEPALGLHDAIDIVENIDEQTILALRASGQLVSWGAGWAAPTAVPTTVTSVTDAIQLVGHDGFACVLRRGGRVACWGRHGTPAVFEHDAPTDVAGLEHVTRLSATDVGILARTAEGALLHLGDPQLGPAAAGAPRPIAGAERADTVVVAGQWICALDRGRVRCWVETPTWSTSPVDVADAAVEIAGTGPRPRGSISHEIPAGVASERLRSRLVVRFGDGRALAYDLDLDHARPVVTAAPLASDARSLLVSDGRVCARRGHGIACAGPPSSPPRDVPHVFDDAAQLLLAPMCALRSDHQVACYANRRSALCGAGRGWSSLPVAVPLP